LEEEVVAAKRIGGKIRVLLSLAPITVDCKNIFL
jgi:hypothetical protein